jgi:hypothetical protein
MAILQMWTTTGPFSGLSTGASTLVPYDTNQIVWPSLASKTGTTASSTFQYQGPNSTLGKAYVKASVLGITAAAAASKLNS